MYFEIGNAPLYHGKTIIRDIKKKRSSAAYRSYDAVDILPEYMFISIPQFNDKVRKEIDEWLYMMKNEEVREDFKSPYMTRVAEKLDVLKMTIEARNEYFRYMKKK